MVRGESFIVNSLVIHSVPTFYEFEAEVSYIDGTVGLAARKIVNDSVKVAPQLEDKVSLYRQDAYLGSTRSFKVINTYNPYRIIESEISDRGAFLVYLTSIVHLGVYCDWVKMRGIDASLASALRYSASVAMVTGFCLVEENPALVARFTDIILSPLARQEIVPIRSLVVRYAGQA